MTNTEKEKILFTDIELLYREGKGYFDLEITDSGDLKVDNSFDTGLNLAIQTDGRADVSEVSRPENQRGTIVDLFTERRNGSKLWLLEQSRNDVGALNRAIDYCKNALKYFVDLQYVKQILVDGAKSDKGIYLTITVYGINGEINRYRYNAWNNSMYRQ